MTSRAADVLITQLLWTRRHRVCLLRVFPVTHDWAAFLWAPWEGKEETGACGCLDLRGCRMAVEGKAFVFCACFKEVENAFILLDVFCLFTVVAANAT